MKKKRLVWVLSLVLFASIFSVSNVSAQESKRDLLSKEITNQLDRNKKLKEGTVSNRTLNQLKERALSSLVNTQPLNKLNRITSMSDSEEDEILFETESNDDFDLANTILLDQGIMGRLLPMYDMDFFKVEVPAEGLLLVGGVTNSDAIALAFAALEKDFIESGNLEYLGYEYEDGVEVQIYQVNKAGTYYITAFDYDNLFDIDDNTEEDLYGIVTTFVDNVAPAMPKVNEVTDKSTSVTGTAEAGSTITVKAGTKVLGTAKTSSSGKYTVTIAKQKAGTKLSVTATDSSGNVSSAKTITVKDVTAPSVPTVNAVSDKATTITGKAETNAKVYAMVGSKKIGEATAKNGAYTITITKQKAGTSISVYAVDAAGNKSASKVVKVVDKTAPSVPTVNAVSDKATSITGKAETNAKVYAMVGSKKIGEATAKNGAYTIKIAKQKAGTSISVYAVDVAGNKSASKTVKVIDKTAPTVPTVNTVADHATSITGKAETNAKVYAMVGGKQIGVATAKNGVYTIKIAKQKAGTSVSVYAVDAAGNKSASKVVKVVDKTPPSVPTVNKITNKTVTVTGKGEKGASIYIYNGSKKIGQGTVDSQGNYKVKITAQKKGASLTIYAQDKAGNKSKSKVVKVS